MYQPKLYTRANDIQRKGSKKLLDGFFDYLKFRSDGKDSLLDVGTGTGDVLMELVYPRLPKTCSKIVGIDISEPMVKHAKQMYSTTHKCADFKVLDIATANLPAKFREEFDHVISFHCLHWVKNHKQAFSNIFNMMTSNGDCLIAFVSSCATFAYYKPLSMNCKWMEYMKDVENFIPSTQDNPNPQLEYTKLFEDLGFRDIQIKIKDFDYWFKDTQSFQDFAVVTNPFIGRIPLSSREEFIKDLMSYCEPLRISDVTTDSKNQKYRLPYQMLIACGRK